MITVSMTEKLAGVEISGDADDLRQLVDAFHELSIGEEGGYDRSYINMSTRVLGLCYDIRHASMGHREVIRRDNGMDDNIANVYYSCKCLYPEMCYTMMALNELINIRARKLAKKRRDVEARSNPSVLWDPAIAGIRGLQAAFAECVREHLAQGAFTRWINIMHEGTLFVDEMTGQFLDVLNITYLGYSSEKREKNLAKIAKRIAACYRDEECLEIKNLVAKGAEEYGCHEEDIRLADLAYPNDIDW